MIFIITNINLIVKSFFNKIEYYFQYNNIYTFIEISIYINFQIASIFLNKKYKIFKSGYVISISVCVIL